MSIRDPGKASDPSHRLLDKKIFFSFFLLIYLFIYFLIISRSCRFIWIRWENNKFTTVVSESIFVSFLVPSFPSSSSSFPFQKERERERHFRSMLGSSVAGHGAGQGRHYHHDRERGYPVGGHTLLSRHTVNCSPPNERTKQTENNINVNLLCQFPVQID